MRQRSGRRPQSPEACRTADGFDYSPRVVPPMYVFSVCMRRNETRSRMRQHAGQPTNGARNARILANAATAGYGPPCGPPQKGGRGRGVLLAALVAGLAVLAFVGSLAAGFVRYDDDVNVFENRRLAAGIGRFWIEPYEGLHIPVTYSLWAVQAQIAKHVPGGRREHGLAPWVFHACNLAAHAACALLVMRLLYLLVRHRGAAAVGALLFALHPMQAESVAWVSEFRGLLAALFALAALGEYVVYAQGQAPLRRLGRRYVLASILFALALLSKPSAAAALPMAAVLNLWLRRPLRSVCIELSMWLGFVALVAVVTSRAQTGAAAGFVPSLGERVLIAGDAVTHYTLRLLMPFALAPDYGRAPAAVLASPWVWVTGLMPYIVGIELAHWAWGRRACVAAGLFVAGLLPVLGLVPFEFQATSTVADRYGYLAMLGPALAVALAVARCRRRGVKALCAAALVVLAMRSVQQTQHWRDTRTLFAHALLVNPTSHAAWHNLGGTYDEQGRHGHAILALLRAQRLKPNNLATLVTLGKALINAGRPAEALLPLERAVRLNPRRRFAHYNMAIALAQLGRTDEAKRHYELEIEANPSFAMAHFNLANLLAGEGQFAAAAQHYAEAIRIQPDLEQAQRGLQRARQAQE